MDIFFADPSEIPLPPDEMTIRQLKADPWPDGRRVKIYLELDPFQRRPSAELVILNPHGDAVASAEIIESMTRKIELNLHLRGELEHGEYTLEAVLFYVNLPEGAESVLEPNMIEHKVVDRASRVFILN